MTSREIFAANVRRLMGDSIKQAGISAAAKRAGYSVDQKTVSRALNDGNPTIDTVAAIAAGLGVQPWQLLIPENVANFPASGRDGGMLLILGELNEEGMRAAVAHAKFLSRDPQFQRTPKGKFQ